MLEPKPRNNSRDEQPSSAGSEKRKLLFLYSEIAFILPAAVFIGWLIGYALDRWLHTHYLYIVGLLVGIAAGFVELIRTVLSGEAQ